MSLLFVEQPPEVQKAALLPLVIHLEALPVVNAALQHMHVPVVSRLILTNPNAVEVGPVHVHIALDPAVSPPWEMTLQHMKPGEVVTFDELTIKLPLSPERLANQIESEHGTIRLTVKTPDDRQEVVKPLDVSSFNQWFGLIHPESIACFVQPNHPALGPVLNAVQAAIASSTGSASLQGYQAGPERVMQIVEAVWRGCQSVGIRYADPPTSFEYAGQKILLPDQVVNDKLGTCLDLSVFLATVLERVGLHPFIVLVTGHAFPGVFLHQADELSSVTTDDVTEITKRVDAGSAVVFDSSALANGVAFNHACGTAQVHYLTVDQFQRAIDVAACRHPRSRILPLPVRVSAFAVVDDTATSIAPIGFAAQAPVGPRVVEDRPLSRDGLPQTVAGKRIARWKSRLLDLSFRNPLLNMRDGRRSLPLMIHDVAVLEDALSSREPFALGIGNVDGLRSDLLYAERTGSNRLVEEARDLLKKRVLLADLPPAEGARRIIDLYRTGRTLAEETGSTGLWLALGFVELYETAAAKDVRRAPILLLPVEIVRGAAREPYKLRLSDDEPRINSTLLKKLENEFGLDVTGYDELPEDDAGLDVPLILQRFKQLVGPLPRCQVTERAAVGVFSFTKHMMWLDLEARTQALMQNQVVRHLLDSEGRSFPLAKPFVLATELDGKRPPEHDLAVVEADSSQLVAVQGAVDGNTFVLEGPPGTGKSQTITNLVAELLGRSQSVLFVAEKRAAVEVVKDRLDKVGLGSFCLDLHAHDATKLEVIQQIAAPLDLAKSPPSNELAKKGADLRKLRDELAIVWTSLHAPGPAGVSAWQAMSRLDDLATAAKVSFDFDHEGPLDDARWDAMKVAARELQWAATTVPRPTTHPFVGSRLVDWDARRQGQIERSLQAVSAAQRAMLEAVGEVERRFGYDLKSAERDALAALARLLDILVSAPRTSPELVIAADDPVCRQRLSEVASAGVARAEAWTQLAPRWQESLLTTDTTTLEAKFTKWQGAFFLLAFFALFFSRKSLAKHGRAPLGRNDAIARDLAHANAVRRHTTTLAERRPEAALAGFDDRLDADYTGLPPVLAWCDSYNDVRRRNASMLRAMKAAEGVRFGLDDAEASAARTFIAAQATLEAALGKLQVDLALDPQLIERATLATLTTQTERFVSNMRELRDWAQWVRARNGCVALGLEPFVRAFEAGNVPADGIERALERSAMAWRVEDAMAREPALARFRGSEHEQRSRAFRDLDEQRQKLAQQEIRDRLIARLPDATFEGGEIGVLKGELRKKRRHLPLRKLFAKIPTILPRLKPCVLMSPMSVAQYLDPAMPLFDVVVFDEASQIPPWDAIGALGRGKRAIIVGDSKQMPPTNFFGKSDSDDGGEDEIEEMESILDECDRSSLPKLSLKWHYRSRHPSLIQFSNHRYYDSQLVTFPAAAAEVATLGVKWLPVDGIYDKGGTRSNEIEAKVVVREIVRRLRDPVLATKTLGVVTFAMPQRDKIEELLDVERQNDPSLDRFFDPKQHPEPVFIKNLENVQGDERDVILFSMSFGPDKSGKVALNFGALNRAGGERRLNVAVTRARDSLVVISSLRPEHIPDGRTSAIGVRHLREFLAFAQKNGAATSADEVAARDKDNAGCVPAITARLAELGYAVDRNVGSQGPRVDIAIRDPDMSDSYLMGIVSDGPIWGRFPSLRDREKLGPSLLARQGWTVHRLWSLDWWHNPERELAKIVEHLQATRSAAQHARTAPPVVTPVVAAPAPVVVALPPAPSDAPRIDRGRTDPIAWLGSLSSPDARFQAMPYQRAAAPDLSQDKPAGHPNHMFWVAQRLVAIVQEEGPMHRDDAVRRAFDSWGVPRVGSKMNQSVIDQLHRFPVNGPRLVGDFLWPAHLDPLTWSQFRTSKPNDPDRRDADSIPPEEIANAAAAVLTRALSLERAELVTQLMLVFGISRRGAKVDDHFQKGLDHLVSTGRVIAEGAVLRVVETH